MALETVSSKENCDVGGIVLDDDTKELKAVSYNYARRERVFFNDELKEDYDMLAKLGPVGAEASTVSITEDEKTWVVAYGRSDGPTEYVINDQTAKTINPL